VQVIQALAGNLDAERADLAVGCGHELDHREADGSDDSRNPAKPRQVQATGGLSHDRIVHGERSPVGDGDHADNAPEVRPERGGTGKSAPPGHHRAVRPPGRRLPGISADKATPVAFRAPS
jgi:hypothetical protein